MAFGFPPKYIESISLDGLSRPHCLVIMHEAIKQLGWKISEINESGIIAFTKMSWSSFGEKITVVINDQDIELRSELTGKAITDWGKNKTNLRQLTDEYDILRPWYSVAELDELHAGLEQGSVPNDEDGAAKPPVTFAQGVKSFVSFFVPAKGYFITPIIINANILLFVVMVCCGVNFLTPDNESLVSWGANYGPLTLNGQAWRLITNCFLHIGIIHLLMNMYALIYIGVLLEPYLGKARFLTAYLLAGVVASTASLSWHSYVVSAGASGAIFGMYGVFFALLTTNLIDKAMRMQMLLSIGIFVVYNLAYGTKGGIDNAAHVGGLFSGIVIGYAYYPGLKNADEKLWKYAAIAGLALFTFSGAGLLYLKMPNDIARYNEEMKTFDSQEAMALEVYNSAPETPRSQLLSEIKDRGIYYWNANIDLVNSADSLNLPEVIHERDAELINYCNLRVRCYNLMYKAVEQNTSNYNDSIKVYSSEIKVLVDDLKK